MSYRIGEWTVASEEALQNWKIEIAVGLCETLIQNEVWTWRALVDALRGPKATGGGIYDTIFGIAERGEANEPELRGVWYPGPVSQEADEAEPVGASLLVYDFEGVPPVALRTWLETSIGFEMFAWCLFTLPDHAPELPRLRVIRPLYKTASLVEAREVHEHLMGYMEDEAIDETYLPVGRSTAVTGVEAWPRQPGQDVAFFHHHSGIVTYTDS